jgi:hypothetical protein
MIERLLFASHGVYHGTLYGDPLGGLRFGAGATLDPGSFFSGLLDEVRIYNRAIVP